MNFGVGGKEGGGPHWYRTCLENVSFALRRAAGQHRVRVRCEQSSIGGMLVGLSFSMFEAVTRMRWEIKRERDRNI